jgi:hypothetical protein
MIVCDENLSQRWINLIKESGYETFSVREHFAGITDMEITKIASPWAVSNSPFIDSPFIFRNAKSLDAYARRTVGMTKWVIEV